MAALVLRGRGEPAPYADPIKGVVSPPLTDLSSLAPPIECFLFVAFSPIGSGIDSSLVAPPLLRAPPHPGDRHPLSLVERMLHGKMHLVGRFDGNYSQAALLYTLQKETQNENKFIFRDFYSSIQERKPKCILE